MKNAIANATSVVLMTCALVVTGLVVREQLGYGKPGAPPPADAPPVPVSGWKEIAAGGTAFGSRAAPVTLVEFSDFQCPFCASLQPTLRALRQRYGARLNVVYRNYPLESIHPYARTAAVAAECAGAQGAFTAYHDALFSRQDQIGVASWHDFAAAAGVRDLPRFDRCVQRRESNPRVVEDLELGGRIALTGTPTLIINGLMLRGSLTEARIAAQIDAAIDAVPAARTALR